MERRTADIRETDFTDQVLVCTNDRGSEHACCADAHGQAVYEAVQEWLRERDLFWSHVHVAETSCLGCCSEAGAAIAIHPRCEWYAGVEPSDVPDLLTAAFGDDGSRLGLGPDDDPAPTTSSAVALSSK